MNYDILNLIKNGEGLKIEFKAASGDIPKSVYETVCAFSNTCGGVILLGVSDDKKILGVSADNVDRYKKDFVTTVNNPTKINPPLYLSVGDIVVAGKTVLVIEVPESSEVHRRNGKIYVRNEDGDLDITDIQSKVSELYMKKQNTYTENRIVQGITINELRSDLIKEARKRAVLRRPDHPWGRMDDMELLRSASLYRTDFPSHQEGFTLAAVLLFGKDDVIHSVLPHYKTDLICKIENADRYDDRCEIKTNLIDSYDKIMTFINKHLPEKFYLDNNNTVRIDIRSVIFREIAVNLLIHREYTKQVPARFIIEKSKIYTDNGNKPFLYGNINPKTNSPYPKNPNIAGFFKEIGLAEELGSGIKNIFKYAKLYAGTVPVVTDDAIFKFEWPVRLFTDNFRQRVDQVRDQVSDQVSDQAQYNLDELLEFMKVPRSLIEIMSHSRYNSRVYFMKKVLKPLLDDGLVVKTVPNKPNSPKQKYKRNSDTDAKQVLLKL